ncbi:hypothetical protein M2360_001537 [Rhizobium sp. SG_E_25_P2]|nr:hypothetical protein [Rhizobium sp. SG_E_25_P2]MDH6266141.1 hypothetical protein [Rhizobium sp. SG_E_25_P2]
MEEAGASIDGNVLAKYLQYMCISFGQNHPEAWLPFVLKVKIGALPKGNG